MGPTYNVLLQVMEERNSQDQKWGIQNRDILHWLAILGEEFGEACKDAIECIAYEEKDSDESIQMAKEYIARCRKELIQVAAVAVCAIENLDRNRKEKL